VFHQILHVSAIPAEHAVADAFDNFDAHYQLASFFLQQGKLQAALPHLERARAIDPVHYANGHDLALTLLELGRLDDARAQVVRMMKANESAELLNLRGDATAPADLRRVEALLRQAVALDRRLAKGFLQLGILLSEQERHQDAIPELRRAVRLDPDLAQGHYRLAQAYQRTGQKALAALELEVFKRLTGRTSQNQRQPGA
jgi:tetratricopeptide (TPR) repeat protein